MKIMSANRIAPDGTRRFAASHLGVFCLPMSHKRTPVLNGLISVKIANNHLGKTCSIVLSNMPIISCFRN